ncbi:MAG: DUF115 domain-containing protein [Treponema sp.]|jgi:hypothetical protein|nr:DUF115 domain-containing protein [Treponema sp.]
MEPVDKQFVFERNILSLSKNDPALGSRLCSGVTTKGRYRFIPSRGGKTIPSLGDSLGGSHPLHSTIDPVHEAQKLLATAGTEGFLIFLGLGGGFAPEAALDRAETKKIIIIEFDLDGLAELFCNCDYINLLQDGRVKLLADSGAGEIARYITNTYRPVLDGGIRVFPLRTRTETEKRFAAAGDEIKQAIETVSRDYSVQAYFGKRWFFNILQNLKKAEGPMKVITPVKEAAICAAGPSLDESIGELKKNICYIIATDTSLPVLLSRGIEPDAVISIDCQHIGYRHFAQGLPPRTTLFLNLSSPPAIASFSGAPFFFTSAHPLERYIKQTWRPLPFIDTSGANVTYAAFSLALELGAREIRIYGADFSYPYGKTYARGAYIYPYFENLSSRFSPLEALHSGFLYRDALVKHTTRNGFYYETPSLSFYRRALLEKINSRFSLVSSREGIYHIRNNQSALSLFSPGPAGNSAVFLKKYRAGVAALASFADSGGKNTLITTLLPLAAAIQKREPSLTPNGLFTAAKACALHKLDTLIHS